MFVVEGTDTEKADCLLSMTVFFFTETALCINDREERNLLSKEIYGANIYSADRLGSP